ncbi:MAG: ATP-binding protein [Planctomycetota bacterium]|nr:ATP-binding protein [Planctomycetota bacterium]
MTAFDLEVLPHVGQVRFLRADLRASLEACGVAEEAVDQLVLVADEIVNNAIEHGASYREAADVLRLHVEVDDEAVRFEFVDPSAPAELVSQLDVMLRACSEGRPPLDSERGRGLFLIADGLEDVRVDAVGDRGLRLSGRKSRALR